ncbi:MAG: peptidoglycan DD-metalloendopeptidase family protein [Firmicutes bacterium]|nr:peptidoglycan DD-metalloendopeptidase family protein [Bacillota bacterium]
MKKRHGEKRIFSILLAFVMVFSLMTFSYGSSLEDELDDVNSQIDAKQDLINTNNEKISELSMEIAALENRINDAQIKIDKLTDSINETKAKIVEKIAELEKKEAEVKTQDENLNARLRAMYKKGNSGMLSVILNSTSITELLTNLELSKRIYAADSDLLYKLKVEYDVIYRAKVELSELKETLELQQADLETTKAALAYDQQVAAEKRAAAQADNREIKAQMDALQARADALVEEIRRLQGDGDYTGGGMCWPSEVSTRITSPFGTRYIFGGYSFHSGIDIGAWWGSNILAANSGVVLWVGWDPNGYGNYVMIDHGGGVVTLYAHASQILVSVGQYVGRGQVIGKVGSTGLSTGAHIHFEIRVNGSYQDPLDTSAAYYVVPGVYLY